MKKLIIENIGPIENVELELKRINVIIGPQSAGKSCILKIACFCAWAEKRIQLEQSKPTICGFNMNMIKKWMHLHGDGIKQDIGNIKEQECLIFLQNEM